jgi:hypothetical protein
MAFARTAIRYNSVGLFLTDSPAYQPKSKDTKFVNRVQSTTISVDIDRQNVKQIGSDEFLARKIIKNGSINIDVDYLLTDGYEEDILGLNICPPSVYYDKNQDAIPVEPEYSGTIYNGLEEDKNLFFMIGEEPFDLTGYANRPSGFSGLDLLSIGNCFIKNYSVSASVGDFAKASVSLQASDIIQGCVGSGEAGFVWREITEFLTALLLQIDESDEDFILFEDEGKILFEEADQIQEVGGARNPALNLAEGGTVSDSGFLFNPYLYHSPINAILPGGITVKIKNLTMGGPLLEDMEGACVNAEANIQSFDISVPFEREDLEGFGSMHVYGRKMKYPQIGTLSLSLLSSAFGAGKFSDLLCEDTEYEVEIEMSHSCQLSCIKDKEENKRLVFNINNAKFDSYSFSNSIGSISTVDCNFSFGMSKNNGLFASGTFQDNKSRPCYRYIPRPEII